MGPLSTAPWVDGGLASAPGPFASVSPNPLGPHQPSYHPSTKGQSKERETEAETSLPTHLPPTPSGPESPRSCWGREGGASQVGGVPCQPSPPRSRGSRTWFQGDSGGWRGTGAEPGPAARHTHHAPLRSAPAAGLGPGRAPSRAASRATGGLHSASARRSLAPELRGARPRGPDPSPAPGRPRPSQSRGPAPAGRALSRVRRRTGSGRRAHAGPRRAATRSTRWDGTKAHTRGMHPHRHERLVNGRKASESSLPLAPSRKPSWEPPSGVIPRPTALVSAVPGVPEAQAHESPRGYEMRR